MKHIARSLEPVVRRAAREFPVVVLTGPRQSGKTTLLRRLLGGRAGYAALDLPDVRSAAAADPRGFLGSLAAPAILDEVQNVPELLPYLRALVDDRRGVKGRFFLTGSQNLMLARHVTESLAGRAAVLQLMPLTAREEQGHPAFPFPWETGWAPAPRRTPASRIAVQLARGWYPELVAERGRDAAHWHAGYIQTYLERDIRSLRQVGDLVTFRNFLRALAIRTGQLLNLADISRDLGVVLNTVKAWLAVLVATHQVVVLSPYFTSMGKRLVKTPKVYFTDTGTLCHLAGLSGPEQVLAGPLGGAVFEAAVVGEVYKRFASRGVEPRLYFWRTSKGEEVDLVVESAGRLIGIEAKSSATVRTRMADGLLAFRRLYGDKVASGWVVLPGGERLPLGPGIQALSFQDL